MMSKSNLVPLFRGCLINILTRPNFNGTLMKYKEKERIDAIEQEAELKIKNALYERDKICRAMDALKAKMGSSTPFKEVAELYADALAEAYGTIAQELRNRTRPANVRADVIERELRQKIRETTVEAKLQKYRWSFLLSIYPELENYVFEDESLISMAEHESMDKFQNNRDAALDFLSIEEYETLSDTEKYQLSLDRYKSSHRQNAWIAGVEYELYCCYILRKNGYYVIENGVRMRKEDMGRDIIAIKDGITYIIQCKRYSMKNQDGTDKYIHENIICQLYGTTIEYQISNPRNDLFSSFEKIVPVLYTTGRLSDMAKSFAEKLHVEIKYLEMGDYPMIKCNINEGRKIYHLPFDQQYWNTRIENEGELYAWTVKEAEEAGFRRAKRWHTDI